MSLSFNVYRCIVYVGRNLYRKIKKIKITVNVFVHILINRDVTSIHVGWPWYLEPRLTWEDDVTQWLNWSYVIIGKHESSFHTDQVTIFSHMKFFYIYVYMKLTRWEFFSCKKVRKRNSCLKWLNGFEPLDYTSFRMKQVLNYLIIGPV